MIARAKWIAVVGCLFLLGSAAARGGEEDRCWSAVVREPMLLPDGRVRGGGTLRLCLERKLSPVMALHEVSLDGVPIGVFPGRLGEAGAAADAEPFFLFVRASGAVLRLEGYATASAGVLHTHDLSAAHDAFEVLTRWELASRTVAIPGSRAS